MHTVLQLCHTNFKKHDGSISDKFNILLDSASDRSYATSCVIRKVRPVRTGQVYIAFNSFNNGGCSKPRERATFNLNLITKSGESMSLEVIEVDRICKPVTTVPLPKQILENFSSITINSPLSNSNGEIMIDILIGIDQYWDIVKESPPL